MADISVSRSFDRRFDYSSPLNQLKKDQAPGSLLFPLSIRGDQFFTVFRIAKRDVEYTTARLQVSENDVKEAEIYLPLPPNLGTAYGASYTNADLGLGGALVGGAVGVAADTFKRTDSILGAAAAGGDLIYNATLGQVVNAFNTNGVADAGKVLLSGLATFAGRAALNTPIGAGIGIANNPYQAVVYSNPEFRTHSFQYNLFARNKDESSVIAGIIDQFKFAMHPTRAGGGVFFEYPRVFSIEYVIGIEDNPFIFKIGTSALTSFSVNYHADGTPSYFDSIQPAPTNVQINMTFQELNFNTREDLEKERF